MYISRKASTSVLAGIVLAVILTGAPLAAGAAAPAPSFSATVNPALNRSPDAAIDARVPAGETQTSNMVNAVGRLLATKPGTPVSVIRAPGRAVWDAVSPDVTTLDTTLEGMSHDFLLVTCTENVQQAGFKGAPGVPIPVIGEVQVVIDTATGNVLEITRVAQGHTNLISPADAVQRLGAPTIVVLSAAAFE
ncbi:hypothetical protein G3T36_02205 [Diaminobutyricibacter tongyongensis]|uniref:Uncharacterized protein n=1 Tax=Leifsonia tongyongensis TaxID=1268043 RepID=A0A6L9XTH5_9MICO|nr:hypothetical protein [Diaminobutyricibacter tongyongensis]NEN04673.1 hypothetical protein [Diaminobutyricibacter tongyongensis]